MLVLTGTAKTELIVKNSHFISEVFTVRSAEEARERLRAQKERYAGFGNVVHAFVVGSSGGIQGCSDDGEPSGTSGRPTLEVLKGSGITNIILTSARHFGGIKLGTGGLVKAYTETAQMVIAAAPTMEMVPMSLFVVQLPYPCYEPAKRVLASVGAEIQSETFNTEVELSGRVKSEHIDSLASIFRDMSRGQGVFEAVPEEGT